MHAARKVTLARLSDDRCWLGCRPILVVRAHFIARSSHDDALYRAIYAARDVSSN